MEEVVKGLNIVIIGNVCKIFLNAEIDEDISQSFVEILYGLEFLHDENPFDAVVISISSPGGNVDAGYAMYSASKMSSLPIYIINSGIVASIAGIIFLGVKLSNRFAFENSLFMLHNASGGNDDALLEKINKSLSTILGTAITPLLVRDLMEQETWLDVSEQANYNIIPYSNIIKVDEPFDISQIYKEEKNIFNIYNKQVIKNNEDKMNLNFIEKLKNLRNTIMQDDNKDSVVELADVIANEEVNNIEEVIEETIVEAIENAVEEIVESVEEEIVESIEEKIGDISNNSEIEMIKAELEAVKLQLQEKENILADIENKKVLDAKKEFLIENKVDITEDLLELDLPKLKNIVNTIKVNRVAPILQNKVGDISTENIPVWENMNDSEKTNLMKSNIELFRKSYKNRKK